MDLPIELPPGSRLVSLAEDPSLWISMGKHNSSVWPEFMLHDEVVDRLWHHLRETFPAYQSALLQRNGRIAASMMAAPLLWDGTDEGLPEGWDDQLERSVSGALDGMEPNTLGALLIVVDPASRAAGLASLMVEAMRAIADGRGFRAVIACVRPTRKSEFPLIPIEEYARWVRYDGLPFDPWLRVHVRAGGRVVGAAPRSMTMRGTLDDWRSWTGLELPFSGEYVVPGATNPVLIDVDRDEGLYHDANIWVVHRAPRRRSRAVRSGLP